MTGWADTLSEAKGRELRSFKTQGIFPNDSINLLAVMLWPEDKSKRQTYYVAAYANTFVRDVDPAEPYQISAGELLLLLDAHSWRDILNESATLTRRATIAGMVFTFMFLMDRLKDRLPPRGARGASLSKAFALTATWAKSGATFRDGSNMLTSRKSIEDCWAEFRSVAHYWSAVQMNRVVEFAPQGEMFKPPHFVKFMQTVSYLQMFGTTSRIVVNKATKTFDPLLLRNSTWKVDPRDHLPRMALPADPDAFDDAPFMEYLRNYRA